VITGSRHPGVLLPSVNRDYRATSRHAAGVLEFERFATPRHPTAGPVISGLAENEGRHKPFAAAVAAILLTFSLGLSTTLARWRFRLARFLCREVARIAALSPCPSARR